MSEEYVLIVDDDQEVCATMADLLTAANYSAHTATTGAQAADFLQNNPCTVVLLDLVMPDVQGLDLLVNLRRDHPTLPIVIFTGHADVETAVSAMQKGATDFVSKPVSGPFLDLRLRRAIELEQAKRLAHTDGLTGLYNHRYFQDRLGEEVDRAARYERPLTLTLLDIDNFKRLNDTFGHTQGDLVLFEFANLLRDASRASDIGVRYGGEEFAIILPETLPEQGYLFADRVRATVEKRDFSRTSDSEPIQVTVSIGVAGLNGKRSKRELVETADQALYRAKREGRNRVCAAS